MGVDIQTFAPGEAVESGRGVFKVWDDRLRELRDDARDELYARLQDPVLKSEISPTVLAKIVTDLTRIEIAATAITDQPRTQNNTINILSLDGLPPERQQEIREQLRSHHMRALKELENE